MPTLSRLAIALACSLLLASASFGSEKQVCDPPSQSGDENASSDSPSKSETESSAVTAFSESITVEASRIAPAPERIPGAVTVLDRTSLQSARAFTTSEALRKAPGVTVRDEEGFGLRPNIGLRGTNPTRSTKVLLLEDGLPLTYAPYGDNATYYHPPLERFETIEIVKGSGQIAFGPATVAGVINYLTPMPQQQPAFAVVLTGGSRDYFNAHLSGGGTWGRTGLLIDVLRKEGRGARENTISELDDVNVKLVHAFSDEQSVTLRANYYGEDSNVTYSGLRQSEYDENPRQNPFANDRFYGDRFGASLVHRLRVGDAIAWTNSLYGASFNATGGGSRATPPSGRTTPPIRIAAGWTTC